MKAPIVGMVLLVSVVGIGATAGAQAAPAGAAPSTIDEHQLVALPGNVYPLARAEFDRGPVAGNMLLEHMLLQLKRSPARERALNERLAALYDLRSPSYHQWLTATEFGDQFGSAPADVARVTRWLKSHGFTINLVYPSQMVIDISGTAAQIGETFHTALHNYEVNGANHIANANDPQIPAALEPVVAGFASLHDFMPRPALKRTKSLAAATRSAAGLAPNFTDLFLGSPQYDVSPTDFATIYNVAPLRTAATPITGAGQTIVLLEDTDMNESDWSTFRTAFGLSSFSGTFSELHPAPPKGAKVAKPCADPGFNGD
ncbi:MAG TPA: protease pro-enzyme activation domain-containing protein, partial [Candidatus Binataceae bacterium]|nr:protease pro-enzyme activation domain-containing protein [Candidatus Binataceae bacterium]